LPFLKFSRDKRGYEHFYLVEPASRGKARTELLYWFRTPPNIKVGRTPFDPDVRRELEAHHPHVAFDWPAIVRTPIPPPAETERWRERRRVERAMRSAEEVGDDPEPIDSPPAVPPGATPAAAVAATAPAADAEVTAPERANSSSGTEPAAEPAPASNVLAPVRDEAAPRGRRRRRRRGPRPQPAGEV
jgi:hypothetical protein